MTDARATQPGVALPADLDARLRGALGMPFLPTVFTVLAEHERYLRAAADAFLARRPDGLDAHRRATRRIGAGAAVALVDMPLDAGAHAQPVGALIDAYNEANPVSLLFALFLWPGATDAFTVMDPPLPDRSENDALLADINACHGDFNVPGFWRELDAGWPEQAASAWRLVRRVPLNPGFDRARAAVRALAIDAVSGAGAAPSPHDAGCSAAQTRAIERILAFYAIVIPTMVIEIECVRHALALAEAAAS